MMVYIIEGSASGLTTPDALADLKSFFKTHTAPSAERTVKQSIERVAAVIRWSQRDTADIRRWLSANS
jgi:hypothetical protein